MLGGGRTDRAVVGGSTNTLDNLLRRRRRVHGGGRGQSAGPGPARDSQAPQRRDRQEARVGRRA